MSERRPDKEVYSPASLAFVNTRWRYRMARWAVACLIVVGGLLLVLR